MAKKVLLIDDDPIFLRLVDQILAQQGFEVLKAGGGQEGLRLLFAEKPDIVLLDEPFSSLDIDTRFEMYSLLQSLRLEEKCLFVIVTHNIHEAVYLCSEIIVSTHLPFQVKSRFEIPFDYPRTEDIQESEHYIRLVSHVSHEFRQS